MIDKIEISHINEEEDLSGLCSMVKRYVEKEDWNSCMKVIPKYMELYPDSAVPHNLMGIVLESQGRHPEAMKHFRAAWSLDSTYTPANRNMDAYSFFDKEHEVTPAYTMEDCMPKTDPGIVQKTVFFLKSLLTWSPKKAGMA